MFDQLNALTDGTPFLMLNALWFKTDGWDSYRRYLQAVEPIVSRYGARAQTISVPQAALIGEFDADLIFFVEWPSKAAFRSMLHDPDYRQIVHLREDALTKSLLVPCLPLRGSNAA